MLIRPFSGPLLAVLAFTPVCSSEEPGTSSSTDPEETSCVSSRNFICGPEGLPFATFAVAVSDACLGPDDPCASGATPAPGETTVQLTQPEAGKVCFEGTVGLAGWGQMIVGFSEVDVEVGLVLETFDAQALGITQMAFTIESPPSGGVGIDGSVNSVLSCPEDPFDCMTWGFNLMDGPDSSTPLLITAPGRVTAPFTHFKQTRPPPVSQTFDTRAIEHFGFGVGPGPYDFCVSDLQFLDAAGQVVEAE